MTIFALLACTIFFIKILIDLIIRGYRSGPLAL